MRCASLIGLIFAAGLQSAPNLQVRILLERVDHSLVVVSPIHEFHSGDRIHLRVTVSEPTDVVVLNRTEADFSIDPIALHPDARVVFGPAHLNAGETDLAPITFDQSAGIEHLFIVADTPAVIEIALRHTQ